MSSTFVTSDPLTVARANAYHVLALALRQPAQWQVLEPASLEEQFRPFGGELSALAEATAIAWSTALGDLEPCNWPMPSSSLALSRSRRHPMPRCTSNPRADSWVR